MQEASIEGVLQKELFLKTAILLTVKLIVWKKSKTPVNEFNSIKAANLQPAT